MGKYSYPKDIIARASKLKKEIEQYLNDIDHWNNEHPNEKINPDVGACPLNSDGCAFCKLVSCPEWAMMPY